MSKSIRTFGDDAGRFRKRSAARASALLDGLLDRLDDPQQSKAPPARTIRIQPEPIYSLVAHTRIGTEIVTSITRVFRPEDVARCQLCPVGHCGAYQGVCQIAVKEYVPKESARMFSVRDRVCERYDALSLKGGD